jgi:hypothetical protein
MKRPFVDTSVYQSRKMETDGNIDYGYWHNKTNDERLAAAAVMIAVVFNEPNFLKGKVDRTIFSARKHGSEK